jgi:hypothetical protein
MKAPTPNKQIGAATDLALISLIHLTVEISHSRILANKDLNRLLIAVVVVVTIVVAIFPIAMVMMLFGVFVPFTFFATIPLTIVPAITVTLVPFAVVPAPRHDDGKLLR